MAPARNGRTKYGATARASPGFRVAVAIRTRTKRIVDAPTTPTARESLWPGEDRLSLENVNVTAVEDINPPRMPARGNPAEPRTAFRAKNPAKLKPEKIKTASQSVRGRKPAPGPYGPSGRSGRITMAMTPNRTAA